MRKMREKCGCVYTPVDFPAYIQLRLPRDKHIGSGAFLGVVYYA